MLGTYLGLSIKADKEEIGWKITLLAIISGCMLLLFSYGLSWGLTSIENLSFATSILSLAPGGLDQMGIIAAEINADLSIVTAFQLFRLFFIYFVLVPIIKVFILYLRKRGKQ